MLLLFVKDALLVAAQAAGALGLGVAALQAVRVAPEDRAVFALAVGYGALGLTGFGLGLLGVLSPGPILALWACGIGMLAVYARPGAPDLGFWQALSKPAAPALIAAAAFLAELLYSHAPPVFDDSVYIYLAIPQAYARAHALIQIPSNPHAYFPQTIEMLYAQLLLFTSAEAPKLLNWAFGAASAFVLLRLIRRQLAVAELGLPLAAFVTMPWVVSLTGSGKIDLGSLFFGLAAFHAWLLWRSEGDDRLFYLSGLLAGFHFATKYTGAAVAAALFLFSLPELRRRGAASAATAAVGFCLLAALPVLPWLARNLLLLGNPIYPSSLPGHPGDPYLYAFLRSTAPHGAAAYVARGFSELVVGDVIWGAGPLLWAFLPAALLLRRPGDASARIAGLGAAACLITAAVFPSVPSTRFIAPGLCLLLAVSSGWLASRWSSIPAGLKAAGVAAYLLPGMLLAGYFGAKRIPLWVGMESREDFVERNWKLPEDYELYRYIRERLPAGSTVLFSYLNLGPGYFYPDQNAIGLGAYPPALWEGQAGPALQRLKADGVRYLVWAPGDCVWEGTVCTLPGQGVRLQWLSPPKLEGQLTPLVSGPHSTLYEIKG